MTRYISLLLCFAITLCLFGCSKDETPTTPSTTASTVNTTPLETTAAPTEESAFGVYESKMAAVSLPVVVEEYTNAAGTVLSTYTYQDVHIVLPDADVAEIITLDLANRIDATRQIAESIQKTAETNYQAGAQWQPYFYNVTYTVHRLDQNILSLYCTETGFDGSPRSTSSAYTLNYDLSTGSLLSLRSIFTEEYSADVLCDLIIESLSNISETDLFADYQDIIRDMFSTNVPVEAWYFTKTGLCFYFAPYEISPFASGTIIAEITYEKLSDMLSDAFFPTEELLYSGQLVTETISASDTDKLEQFSQFGELSLSNGTERMLVYVDGSVTNVRITLSTGNNNDEKVVVFAVAGLGPQDAIIVEASQDVYQNLTFQYDTNGETTTVTP